MKTLLLTAPFLIILAPSAGATGATDSVVYAEGDTTCSGTILKYTRFPDPAGTCSSISSTTGCIKNSQGKNLPISTSSRFFCVDSMLAMPPKSGPNSAVKAYAVRETYIGGKCSGNATDIAQVDGLMTGGCYLFGPSYFTASCTEGGSVSLYSCSDKDCRNCITTFSNRDEECDSGLYKYKCVTVKKMKEADPTITGGAAASFVHQSLVGVLLNALFASLLF